MLQRLRTALAAVVAGVPTPVTRPVELQRALGIDLNLASKVYKVVSASGALAAGPHVPGLAALRRFLRAARRAGVVESLVEAALNAAGDFDRLVTSHAGDRTAFDSMISSFAGTSDAAQITLQHRRNAFRSQRHIFGVQARTQVKCGVLQPASDPRLLDIAQVGGFVSLRQLRPEAPLMVLRAQAENDDGTAVNLRTEPLDPSADAGRPIALVREFCSQPPPEQRIVRPASGGAYSEMVGSGFGKQAAITYFEGYVARAVFPRYRDAGNYMAAMCGAIRIPCEVMVLDLLVHEDAFGRITPNGFSCAEHLGEVPAPGKSEDWQRLGPLETAAYLGKGPSALLSADVPRYPDLAKYVFDRLGWDGERFDVYRYRVEYPVLPSSAVLSFDLPEPPAL